MDHILELPADPAFGPVHVPYISGAGYDNQGFHDYPLRKGWNVNRLYQGDAHGRTTREVQRILQSWLFFGALSEFLDSTLDPLDFACEDDNIIGGLRLSTRSLEKRLARWKARMSTDYDQESAKQRGKAILDCLDRLSELTRSTGLVTLMGPELHLTVCILGSTLDRARLALEIHHSVDDQGFVARQTRQHDLYFRFGSSSLLEERLRINGWCASQIALMERELTPVAMYYTSMLKRPLCAADHSDCSSEACFTNQVYESTYKTQHARAGCACEYLTPDANDIARVLDQGGIPVIGVTPGSEGQPCKVRVVHIESEGWASMTPYVAISHVWKDGLGNLESNSLPSCQVERLRHLVSRVYNQVETSHNDHLQSRAEGFGDTEVSVDDILYKMKEGISDLKDDILSDVDMLLASDLENEKETFAPFAMHQSVEASSSKMPSGSQSDELRDTQQDTSSESTESPTGRGSHSLQQNDENVFMFTIMDSLGRDFMPHHGTSGKFNLDWKAFDMKEMWKTLRELVGFNPGEEVFLWLDTLCIPKSKRLREIAIKGMRHVFANAEKVLVLDSELMQVSGATSLEEVLTRINFSGWMQRGWTLEEAAVGSILLFQFEDGVFNLWRYARTWLRRTSRSLVFGDASRPWVQMRQLQQPRHHIQQMQVAHDTLENRTTSKSADLNIIFSALMGINVKSALLQKDQWPARARVFSTIRDQFASGFLWVSNQEKDENYLSVGISATDKMSQGVIAGKDPNDSAQYFDDLKYLDEHVGKYREAPGFVIRCSSLITSPYDLTEHSEFFAFHKDKHFWIHVIRDAGSQSKLDALPRRPGDSSVILTPLGLPSTIDEHVPGILISYYRRVNLGGARLTRVGVNFSTFRSRISLGLPSGADQEMLRRCAQVPTVLYQTQLRTLSCVLASDAFREDTMWCLE